MIFKDDQMGEITVSELHEGMPRTRKFPTYTCGHCSQVVVMRADRIRERTRCGKCQKLLCEQNKLCRADCTPIHALARDKALDDPKWARLAPAILSGCTTEEEARRRGFNV